MKYLVLLLVLAVAYMVWRQGRLAKPGAGAAKPTAAAPEDMVSCAQCGLHLPRPEAIAGPDGALYCSSEHRRIAAGGP